MRNLPTRLLIIITDKVSRIIEAYCGIGAISLYLNNRTDEIIGIDIEKKAIENAEENARMNGITNARFIAEDASSAVRKLVREKRADVLVVDPPRSGLDEKLLECLRDSDIATIIYVSCNPATLAKDLSILKKSYRIEKVKGFDMFPNTALVETVCCLYHK